MHKLHACIRILGVCVCIQLGCACILVPRNVDLGFLLFCIFRLVLIMCLGFVMSSFHMFRSRVSRITCFACFDY